MRKHAVLTATITALLLALISTPAHASVPPNGTYLCTTGVASSLTPNFTITNGVVSSGTSCAGAVVIPAGVTSIGDSEFQSATALTSITIPASVTSIGTSAFRNATSLTSITFAAGSTLTSIGDGAFYVATSLTSITIPASVTSIGASAFENATTLTYLCTTGNFTISSGSVTTHSSCAGAVVIPAGVTSIGASAF